MSKQDEEKLLAVLDVHMYHAPLVRLKSDLFTPTTWIQDNCLYKGWKSDPVFRHGSTTLWLTGDSGVGKSMTLASVVQELTPPEPKSGAPVLQMFCGLVKDGASTAAHVVLCGLLFQLLSHARQLCVEVFKEEQQATHAGFALATASLGKAFVSALRQARDERIYIVIDALDECSNPTDLIRELQPLISPEDPSLTNKVRLMLSSRATINIPLPAARPGPAIQRYEHLELHPSLVETAVNAYITEKLEGVKFGQSDNHFRKVAATEISRNVSGNWLLAYFGVAVFLGKENWSRTEFNASMSELRNLGSNLNGRYTAILKRIPERRETSAKKLFKWLAVCRRPLTVEEASMAIALNPGHESLEQLNKDIGFNISSPEWLIMICGPLIRVHHPTREVSLAHHSVREYFTSDANVACPKAWKFALNEAEYHTTVGLTAFMAFHEFSEPSPHLSIGYRSQGQCPEKHNPDTMFECWKPHPDSQYENDYCTMQAYPLLKYTATHWANHMKVCENQFKTDISEDSHTRTVLERMLRQDMNLKFIFRLHQYFVGTRTASLPRNITPDHIMSYFGLADVFSDIQASSTRSVNDPLYASSQLVMAAIGGQSADVRKWISTKNIEPSSFVEALESAVDRGFADIVGTLLDKFPAIPNASLGNSLEIACAAGHLEIAKSLITSGADINSGSNYISPLEAAAYHGYLPVVKLLIDKKADLDRCGCSSRGYGSALHSSCAEDNFDVVKALVNAGGSLSVIGGPDGTILQSSVHGGSLELTQFIVEHGALDSEETTGYYGSALNAAVEYGLDEIAAFLRKQATSQVQPMPEGRASVHHDEHIQSAMEMVNHEVTVGRQSSIERRAVRIIGFIESSIKTKNERTLKFMLQVAVETFKVALRTGHEGFLDFLAIAGMRTLMLTVEHGYEDGTVLLASSWVKALLWAVENSEGDKRPSAVRRVLEVCIGQLKCFIARNQPQDIDRVFYCAIELFIVMVEQQNPDLLAIYVDIVLETLEFVLASHYDTRVVKILGRYVSEYERMVVSKENQIRPQNMAIAAMMALQEATRKDRKMCVQMLLQLFEPAVHRVIDVLKPANTKLLPEKLLRDKKTISIAELLLDVAATVGKIKEVPANGELYHVLVSNTVLHIIEAAKKLNTLGHLEKLAVKAVQQAQRGAHVYGPPVSSPADVVDMFCRVRETADISRFAQDILEGWIDRLGAEVA